MASTQPDLDAPRTGDRRARRRPLRRVRLQDGGGHRRGYCLACGRATCWSPAATATPGSARRRARPRAQGHRGAARADRHRPDRRGLRRRDAGVGRGPRTRAWTSATSTPWWRRRMGRRAGGGRQHGGYPLGVQPPARRRLRDVVGHKALTGHSDVLIGAVSVRDDALAESSSAWRTGAILGPFEAWLAHRSLATLGTAARAGAANAVRWRTRSPGATTSRTCGGRASARPSFALPTAEAAQAFLEDCELVSEAKLRRRPLDRRARARWATDDVPEGSSASPPAARTPRTSSRRAGA